MAEDCTSFVSVYLLESWPEAIATSLLHGLENAIKTGVQMAKVASNALTEAKDAAIGFTKEARTSFMDSISRVDRIIPLLLGSTILACTQPYLWTQLATVCTFTAPVPLITHRVHSSKSL